jgi:predicted nucleic acid-binding protein
VITAVDANVLLDVFEPDATYGPGSSRALRGCLLEGSLIACDVVWAEVAAWAPSADALATAMSRIGVRFDPLEASAAELAGAMWRAYRRRRGPRDRIIPDFLIGAHAATRGDRLLTRDRGFYRTYFNGLTILDPRA